MLDANETAGLEEGEGVGRVVENVAEVLVEDVELLPELVVVGNVLLVGDNDGGTGFVEGLELCEMWAAPISKGAGRRQRNDAPSSRCGTLAVFWNW